MTNCKRCGVEHSGPVKPRLEYCGECLFEIVADYERRLGEPIDFEVNFEISPRFERVLVSE